MTGLLVAGTLVTGFVSCGAVSAAGGVRMRRRIAETPALLEAARARDGRRPVLRGQPTTERQAWLDYDTALERIARSGWPGRYDHWGQSAWYLEALAAGARCGDGGGRPVGNPDQDWLRNVTNLTDCAARDVDSFIELERHAEALDLASDLLTFAHDISFNATLWTHLYGLRAYRAALDRIRSLLMSPTLPAHLYAEIARRLELADASFPLLDVTWANNALVARIELTAEWSGGTHDRLQGLSPILGINRLYADAIDVIDDHARRAAALSRRPWNQAQAEADALMASVRSRWNPILSQGSFGPHAAERSLREVLARLRILRAYTAWRATHTVPDLADPFGDRIRADVGAPRFWSVGEDGFDEDGLGTWDGRNADIVFDPR